MAFYSTNALKITLLLQNTWNKASDFLNWCAKRTDQFPCCLGLSIAKMFYFLCKKQQQSTPISHRYGKAIFISINSSPCN